MTTLVPLEKLKLIFRQSSRKQSKWLAKVNEKTYVAILAKFPSLVNSQRGS